MRVDLLVALGVMLLDMFKPGRVSKRLAVPVQMPEPLVQRGIAGSDVADVALEMLDVHRIEADDGGVETHVGLGELRAKIVGIGVRGEVGFGAIERAEEGLDAFLVGFLSSEWEWSISGDV